MDNDIVPNDSEALGLWDPPVPEDVEEAEREEQATIGSATPIIEELLEWFDQKIALTDSISTIDVTSKGHLPLETQIMANQLVKDLLVSKRSELLARFDSYQRRNEDEDATV